jgi:class 3 adenylate cyclase/streptogramin lyase
VVFTVNEDHTGTLWVGTQKGLQQLDRQTGQFGEIVLRQIVRTLFEDRSGTPWIGTAAGLTKIDRATQQFTNYRARPNDPQSLSSDRVAVIYEDRQGGLWIGTYDGGLNKFDREKGQIVHYRANPGDPNSLSHDNVTAILEDQKGMLWIGTAGGLNKFDPATQTFRQYTVDQGLPNNTVYGILEDSQGDLWISTNHGLARFNPQTEKFRNYYLNDGLQSNEFNGGAYFKSRSGEMFFGGINGFNAFFPEQVKDNPYIPPIVMTDFQIFNKSVKPLEKVRGKSVLTDVITETNTMTLSYRHYVFSFEFASLHYTLPEANQYAYILEGFEQDWNYVGNRRFATYTNLPSGKYTFRVKGTNSDGVWNETGAAIALTVTPPPWKTWWAYTLYGLAVIGMFLGYIRYKQIQYKRERAILDRFVPYEYLRFLGKKTILDVNLGDHISKEMGVMFSDIRSFTTISETMTPQENFNFVNAYLKRVAPIIRGNDGFIVKFLGDGMMAVFPNGAEDGVKAGIAKLTQVKEYNVRRQQEGWKPIKIGIGVHTGHMMVGMVGEKARMQGDAFSDNVNLTARLEGLTKYYGVSLLISGETLKALNEPNHYHVRFLDNVAVKGKEKPITIYEIFDADPEDLFEKKLKMMPEYEEGQRLYFAKDFAGAITRFKRVLEVIPDDLTTQIYFERAEKFLQEGVPDDWDGVQKMDKK